MEGFNVELDLKKRNELVLRIIELIANRQYQEVEALSGAVRLDAAQLRSAVSEYGRHLVSPPIGAEENVDYVVWVGSKDLRWSAWTPLYTREEGRSDLGLELTLIRGEGGAYRVEIDNIRVP